MSNNDPKNFRLFISRQLSADSVFHRLKLSGWTITDRSLLNIQYLSVSYIPESDWIFFYSPNGVKAFAYNVEQLNYDFKSAKIAAYGPGTAAAIELFNWPVSFTGTGEASGTLMSFKTIAADSKVLFPKALHSKHALLAAGEYSFHSIDLIVYENSMNPLPIPVCDIYIFTSSLNVRSFFEINTIQAGSRVIAIGKPTSDTLSEYYSGQIFIPGNPTESALYHLMMDLVNALI